MPLSTFVVDRLAGETWQRARFTGTDADDFVHAGATPGSLDERPWIETGELTPAAAGRIAAVRTETRIAASLQERHEAELEKMAQTHRAEIEGLSQDFASTMGATIATRLQELEDRVVGLTATSAARLLSGVLSDELGRRSVERMVKVMRTALEDRDAVKITIRGPASLYEPLRHAMGAASERMRFIEAPGADLSVSIDETVYETRLAEWSGALSEVIA